MSRGARLALLASLALAWANFLTTGRWAHVAGALHGWRKPWVFAALALLTVLAVRGSGRRPAPGPLVTSRAAFATLALSAAILLGAFLWWFPPATWSAIPFLDNWTPRFQSTVDQIALLRRGAFNGWEWRFLGGYHTSSDITQNLGVLGFVPMTLLGPTVGFHALQLALFFAVPALVYIDLRREAPRAWAPLSAALACLLAGNFSYMLVRSGDTNSIAGLACTALALVGSHAARRGERWGWAALVGGAVLTVYAHAGFVAYAAALVALDAFVARDARTLWRGIAAFGVAAVVSLPSTWEILRHPEYFNFNNVVFEPGTAIPGPSVPRRILHNIQLLFLPGRWTNDYTGLTAIFLPVVAYVAWRERRTRVGFYAAAVLLVELMLRFNVPHVGYVFSRPIHLFVLFTPAVVAWFVLNRAGTRAIAAALVVFVGLYLQIIFPRVPHVRTVREFDAGLVERVTAADGALVLVENSPHRDMNADPTAASVPTPFGVHFEPLLAAETGRRLYAGFWDGWQWCPWRGQALAGGTIFGRGLDAVPHERFEAEMRRWGVRRLLVWSGPAVEYLRASPVFRETWRNARWREFLFTSADPREVVLGSGSARLVGRSPLGVTLRIEDGRAGDRITIRTNYHPAWTATYGGRRVALFSEDGQLAFSAPAAGSYDVVLEYPRRAALSAVAAAVFGLALAWPWVKRTARRR